MKRLLTALWLVRAELQGSDSDYAQVVRSSGFDAAAMIDPLITLAAQFLTDYCRESGDQPLEVVQRLIDEAEQRG